MAAGCIFAKKEFISLIPYDPNYYFYGEELSMALRAFIQICGMLFHIPRIPIFHLYTDVNNMPRKLHWDPEDEKKRAIKWNELDKSKFR